jgi:hypothetical protein
MASCIVKLTRMVQLRLNNIRPTGTIQIRVELYQHLFRDPHPTHLSPLFSISRSSTSPMLTPRKWTFCHRRVFKWLARWNDSWAFDEGVISFVIFVMQSQWHTHALYSHVRSCTHSTDHLNSDDSWFENVSSMFNWAYSSSQKNRSRSREDQRRVRLRINNRKTVGHDV